MPGVRLESAIEQLDRDERAAIERNAAKLSVKLLMPTGLCFLPAFVLVGVIPAIAVLHDVNIGVNWVRLG